MSGFVLHPGAFADLDEIWEYIATDNLDAANRILGEVDETIRSLVSFPHLGHIRADLTSRPLRFHAVREYLIAYAPEEKPLVIVAILHGRRNPRVIAALLNKRD
jgi:plasmid stabilization system protein ParE